MNPMVYFQQMIQRFPEVQTSMQNPMIQNAIQMAQRNDIQGLQSLAQNLSKEKGVNLSNVQDQVLKRLGMK